MKYITAIFVAFLLCFSMKAEVRIHMEKEIGVYKVPCKVNGLNMKFIFDTGAANVCISSTYAEMMLENGYLEASDIIGSSQSTIADGSVINNTVVNLRTVEIGGLTINNVTANVISSQNAPLLLGQSVIQKLGKVSIDGDYLVIHNANIYTEEEIESIYQKAMSYYSDEIYGEALKNFKLVNEYYGEDTKPFVLFKMGCCYFRIKDRDTSIEYFLKAIKLDDGKNEDNILFDSYSFLSSIYYLKDDFPKSLEYSKLALKYAVDESEKAKAFFLIGASNAVLKNHKEGISCFDKAIDIYGLILKKRNLKTQEAKVYVISYENKGLCLEGLNKFDEAIEVYMTGKSIVESYKNEDFYQDYVDSFNNHLSNCYKELTKH